MVELTRERVGELEYGLPYYDVLTPASPAAGANLSVPVDGAWAVRVLAATATLTTDANAANRFFALDFIQGRTAVAIRNAPAVVIPASQTNQVFHWQHNRDVGEWNTNTPFFSPLSGFLVPPGWTLQFTVDNKQAGDQISAAALFVVKYQTGPEGVPLGVVGL